MKNVKNLKNGVTYMSDWATDIAMMHSKFGVRDWFEANKDNKDLMDKYLRFRLSMCKEELDETLDAIEAKDPEEIVDGLIDMCVFAIGTLDVFGVDPNTAWDRVYEANIAKNVGVKEGRPNPFGLPDLIKPEGWVAPSHDGNHGDLNKAL
jgi:predicted HAD superfamily Cof-like phosphohydrolase